MLLNIEKDYFFYEIKEDIKQFLFDATANMDVTIVEIETDQDHIHMLIKYKPSMAISDIVSRLKQYSTYKMWIHHKDILNRHYWKRKTLWPDGYFVCSIGQVSQKTIEAYIWSQG